VLAGSSGILSNHDASKVALFVGRMHSRPRLLRMKPLQDFDFAQDLKVSAGHAAANPSGTVSAAVSTMAEQCDQNDDGDRHT
jgi:hypothetical protein